jgi:SOS-response transcriptional repressor LexA
MTPTQKQILDFIVAFRAERGYSPTLQEIADSRGVAKITIHEQVHAMIRKGILVHTPHVKRSLRLAGDKIGQAVKILQDSADELRRFGDYVRVQDELRRAAGILMGA